MNIDKHTRATFRHRRHFVAAIGMGLGLALGASPAASQDAGRLGAVLQGLDKTTARVSTIEAPLDEPARFGSLQIVARACHKKPPTETPESAAFLEIVDVRPDSPSIPLFTGWMFASSPAISALEHPVYDVWVIDCRMIVPAEADSEAEEAGAAGEAVETSPLDLGKQQAE